MWDPKHQSWRLVFAFLPESCASPPMFFSLTWKKAQQDVWRTLNTPRWQLFKDLRMRKPDTETMHIQMHGTDLVQLRFSGKLKVAD